MKRLYSLGILASILVLSSACTSTISKGVNADGKVSDEVVFPTIDLNNFQQGIYPNIENLKKVNSGITKTDLYYLFGVPHFKEIHGAKEWDYIFKFYDKPTNTTTICQYKVIFDKKNLARSFFYYPRDNCAKYFTDMPKIVTPPPIINTPINLSADGLFYFDKTILLPEGKRQIAELANYLKNNSFKSIEVKAYTDRLGSDQYNLNLSERRAHEVKRYLVSLGLPFTNITAIGMGKDPNTVECPNNISIVELRSCLQPNRRVELNVAK